MVRLQILDDPLLQPRSSDSTVFPPPCLAPSVIPHSFFQKTNPPSLPHATDEVEHWRESHPAVQNSEWSGSSSSGLTPGTHLKAWLQHGFSQTS